MKQRFKMNAFILVLFAVILTLSACSSGSNNTKSNNNATPAASEPAASGNEKLVIGFAQIGAESEWRTANTISIQNAIKDAGHELKFSDAQQKQENQISAIRTFIAQKVDAIVFSPVVETGFETVMQEAKDAGIPIFLVDRAVDIEDDSLWVTFLGSDFVEEGRKAARWLVEEMEGVSGDINIVELQGTVGSAPAIDRKVGFEEILADHPQFKIIESQTGDFTRAKGKEVMEAFLRSQGDNINVLYAHNDDMAIGAIQAIEEFGLKPAEDIIVIGVDAVRGAFEAMAAGKMNVTIECNPLLGEQVVGLIEDYMAGVDIPKRVASEESMYTMDQAAELLPTRQY